MAPRSTRTTSCSPEKDRASGGANLARPADRNAVHAQRRLADPDRHTLAVLAAGADAGIKREVVADHADGVQVARAVADQHRPLDRRADLAVFQFVGLSALKHVFA